MEFSTGNSEFYTKAQDKTCFYPNVSAAFVLTGSQFSTPPPPFPLFANRESRLGAEQEEGAMSSTTTAGTFVARTLLVFPSQQKNKTKQTLATFLQRLAACVCSQVFKGHSQSRFLATGTFEH